VAYTCLRVQILREWLGKGIKCRNFTCLFIGFARLPYVGV
jgi:hypothetical protein